MILVRPKPVVGRWDVPQTVESAKGGHSSLAKSPVVTPTPTPVVLPEQAQVPILMYHYVSPLPPNPDDPDAIPIARSGWQKSWRNSIPSGLRNQCRQRT